MQCFVDAGGQLTHEQSLLLLDEFLKQRGKLSHEDSLMFAAQAWRTSKKEEAAAPAGGASGFVWAPKAIARTS
jgi:hypothetical protein